MKESGIKLVVLALALIGSSAASASTTVLNGKGFDIVYTGGTALAAASAAFAAPVFSPLSLSTDGKSVIFDTSALKTSDSDALSELSFSIIADKGYTFSGLSLFATGTYAVTRDKANEAYAGLASSVSINGSSVKPLADSADVTKTLTTGRAENGNWTLKSNYDLSSVSFATASRLDFSSSLLLSSFVNTKGLATINTTDYSLQVATAPVPEPEQWMMMLAGIGMLGTIIGRRSRG